ncbi:MAG: carboxypeptidase-like regulatory domain-containing protein, partial [Pyrinomonadaceae bacterium]|nr:carboxypeptidase-like regulatory domain-containing protein [Pyrinomonadaceae bacterium]
MKTIKIIIASLAIVAGLAGSAMAQTGSITGSVTDANGEAVPGANVTAANPSYGINRAVVSNDQGVFVFPQIP